MYEKDINLPEIVVMKKISLLLAAILASVTVSGCDAFTSFFGGDSSQPQDQQKSDDDSKKEDNGNSEPWEQEEQESDYAVAFNNNEGSGYMAIQTTDGSEFVVPQCTFTRTGYHFIKWGLLVNEDWSYYFVGDKITGIKSDIILYAIWEEDSAVSYTVSFNNNGGTGVMENQTTIGSTYKTPACTFTKTNYEFSKWALNSPTGQQYAVESTIGNITSDIVLYAVWKEQSYTVTLYANNGTSTSSTATTNGFIYITPSCSFSYSGHSFDGWAYGSPTGTKYSVNQQIINIHENISLYATWTEQSSSGYYSTTGGKSSNLLDSLSGILTKGISYTAYGSLRYAYVDTDVRPDGYLYDIYSDNTKYVPGSAHDNYQKVGDAYNKEHTIPKSWWGGGTVDQGQDLYIVLPSDGKVNGERSAHPYGITSTGTSWRLSNDPSGNRVGASTETQYVSSSVTVFEQFESRKGDLARIYFYAAAAYWKTGSGNGGVKTWTTAEGSNVFSADGTNGFVPKYLNLLLKWHHDDPVSDWEIGRNDRVHLKQGNRNPFVDHPSWVDIIWGGTYSGKNAESYSEGTVVNGVIV